MQTILPIDPAVFWMALRVGGALLILAFAFVVFRASGAWHGSNQADVPWEQFLERQSGTAKVLLFVVALVFLLALVASAFVLWSTIDQVRSGASQGINLGSGTLIAALLGAPFLIWGTWLKYQTVRFQKEGHMTDRISKAVEQLGAEKTVKVRTKDVDGKEITVEETKPNIEVRIGAILSLERIAQDSTIHDKGRDHVRVMEILCAYIRENAKATSAKNSLRHEWQSAEEAWDGDPDHFEEHFCKKKGIFPTDLSEHVSIENLAHWAERLVHPREDISIAMQVIGRRTEKQRRVEAAWPSSPTEATVWPFDIPYPSFALPDEAPMTAASLAAHSAEVTAWRVAIESYKGFRLDLSNCNLQGIDLSAKRPDSSDAVFSGALLVGSRLEGASIESARLVGASLSESRLDATSLKGSQLCGADFSDAVADGADFSYSQVQSVNFEHSSLSEAKFVDADSTGASFWKARSIKADFSGARLPGVSFLEASIQKSYFADAGLEQAILRDADLRGCEFLGARFQGAAFVRTVLENAVFHGAELSGASFSDTDFRLAHLSRDQLEEVFGDGSMTGALPFGSYWPPHWPVWALPERGDLSFDEELAKWRANRAGYVPPSRPVIA